MSYYGTCTWYDNEARHIVHNKKAIGACMFISFLGYTAAVLIGELKRGNKVSDTMTYFI